MMVTKSSCRRRCDDDVDELARCNLTGGVLEDDEGAGELVDPDPVVPMVGVN
jgi:hypothetical protein